MSNKEIEQPNTKPNYPQHPQQDNPDKNIPVIEDPIVPDVGDPDDTDQQQHPAKMYLEDEEDDRSEGEERR